ncbi:UDP-N-acetyl-D-mannosamine dehydrogenase [Corynebacterium resistens]
MSIPSVAFVGLGYIGLPTAVVMANSGVDVTGIDINADNVARINRGEVTIVEPGLEDELRQALNSGRFRASTEQVHAETYIIAVPTPFTHDYNVDMKYIYSAAEAIAPMLKGGELLILESTSPPLTTRRMAEKILSLRPDLVADGQEGSDNRAVIYFAHCPERILPGKALEELRTNDRIIGGQTPEAAEKAASIYATFCRGELLKTTDVTAEMAKLTENSFRDVNIAFANELSRIADYLDIDIWELIELANHHPRVNILQPGPGVGGHCIAVDPWFIVAADPTNAKLIRTAREVNDSKPDWVIEKVTSAIPNLSFNEDQATIAILGLSFKANIDDLRESPAVRITSELAQSLPDNRFIAVEPNISKLPDALASIKNLELLDLDDAVKEADLVVLLVDHDEFKSVPNEKLNGKKIVDTKGIWR